MQFLPTLISLLRLLSQDNLQLQLQPPDPRHLPEPVGFIRNMQETVFHVGKLAVLQVEFPIQPAGSPPLASVPEEICCSSLIFLKDILTDREFLVDSGASVSVFPGPKISSDNGVHLTADGSPMVCSGLRIIPLPFTCGSGSKVYNWNFQLAQVSVPILKAYFLQRFNPLINIKGCCVVHADCLKSIIVQASPGPQPAFRCIAFLSTSQCVFSPTLALLFSLNLGD